SECDFRAPCPLPSVRILRLNFSAINFQYDYKSLEKFLRLDYVFPNLQQIILIEANLTEPEVVPTYIQFEHGTHRMIMVPQNGLLDQQQLCLTYLDSILANRSLKLVYLHLGNATLVSFELLISKLSALDELQYLRLDCPRHYFAGVNAGTNLYEMKAL